MSIPFRFDDGFESGPNDPTPLNADKFPEQADQLWTQAGQDARREQNKIDGDKSKALTGSALGPGGAVAVNACVPDASALPEYSQPNPAPAPTTTAPPAHLDALNTGLAPNYQQPGVITPKANPSGATSVRKPMGL